MEYHAALAGASRKRLERLVQVAIYEKSRYFANRIAQTEIGQAYSKRRAAEIMADDTIEVVQWRLSGAHPVEDVCDLFARVDRYGLGPGCYPKRRAPRPLAHPFCLCRLRTRPDLRAADARERTDAEREFLTELPEKQAARLMGSRARLKRVLGGQDARVAWNRGREADYRVMLLGERSFDRPGGAGRQWAPVTDAYEVAKAGGRHHGLLMNYRQNAGGRQIEHAIRSYEKRLAEHRAWIKDPSIKLGPFVADDVASRRAVDKWRADIKRITEERDVMIGLQLEKKR